MPHGDSAALIFFTMPAALGIMRFAPPQACRLRTGICPVLLAVIIAAYLPHMYLTLRPSAEDQDYRLYAKAVAALPGIPVAFAELTPGDTPVIDGLPLESPEWFWRARNGRDRRLNLVGWWNLYRLDAISEPSYIYIGPRCFARPTVAIPQDATETMHPACRRIIENIEAEAVFSQSLNSSSRSFGRLQYNLQNSCKDCRTGLYRINGLRNRDEWKEAVKPATDRKDEYRDHDRIRQKARPF